MNMTMMCLYIYNIIYIYNIQYNIYIYIHRILRLRGLTSSSLFLNLDKTLGPSHPEPGWSWVNRDKQNLALFCKDHLPIIMIHSECLICKCFTENDFFIFLAA